MSYTWDELDELRDSGEYEEVTAEHEGEIINTLVTNIDNYRIESAQDLTEEELNDLYWIPAILLEDIDDIYTAGTEVALNIKPNKIPEIILE